MWCHLLFWYCRVGWASTADYWTLPRGLHMSKSSPLLKFLKHPVFTCATRTDLNAKNVSLFSLSISLWTQNWCSKRLNPHFSYLAFYLIIISQLNLFSPLVIKSDFFIGDNLYFIFTPNILTFLHSIVKYYVVTSRSYKKNPS